MRYLHIDEDRLVIRPSERDLLLRGTLLLFAAPFVVATLGWLLVALLFEEPTPLELLAATALIGLACGVPALLGLLGLLGASRRAASRAVVIDLGERLLTRCGRPPEVFRSPDRVRVSRAGLSWTLSLESAGARTELLRSVPYGSGGDLAREAEVLAEHLEVTARVPAAARRASGLVPSNPDTLAAIACAPLDGVNLVYSLFALMSSRHPRLRFAAKQSLALLGLELLLALGLLGCLGLPLALVPLPAPLEAVALALPLLLLFVVRTGVRLYAAYAAARGRVFVIPGLGLLSRRWAPDAGAPEGVAVTTEVPETGRPTPVGDPFSAGGES